MIAGYLSEDKKIYDKNIRFIRNYGIDSTEKIITENEKVNCSVSDSWGIRCNAREGLDSGEGRLLITNRRLIFIRPIRPFEKYGKQSFLPLSLVELATAKKLRNMGLKEYFELPFEEVLGYKLRRKICTLYVLSNKKKRYSVFIPKNMTPNNVLTKELNKSDIKDIEQSLHLPKYRAGVSKFDRMLFPMMMGIFFLMCGIATILCKPAPAIQNIYMWKWGLTLFGVTLIIVALIIWKRPQNINND